MCHFSVLPNQVDQLPISTLYKCLRIAIDFSRNVHRLSAPAHNAHIGASLVFFFSSLGIGDHSIDHIIVLVLSGTAVYLLCTLPSLFNGYKTNPSLSKHKFYSCKNSCFNASLENINNLNLPGTRRAVIRANTNAKVIIASLF